VNVSKSIRAMVEWTMPICAASIHLNRQCSTRFIPLHPLHQYVEGMSIADLLESIMDGLNPSTCSSCLVTKTHVFVIGVFKNHLLLQSSYNVVV